MPDDKHNIDGWNEFLDARMRVLRSALRNGYSPAETNHLVGVSPTQLALLCMTADELNEREDKQNA